MTESLIDFTDNAIEHINKALTRYPQGGGFRLSIKKTGCSGYKYIPEILAGPKPGDIEFVAKGLKVFVDPGCANAIKGTLVDLVKKGLGQKILVFLNPNVTGECGCGESFHLKEDDHGQH